MKPGQHRETARVVLVNNENEVFLLLTEFDPEVNLPARWLTPGGGIDQGETILSAALRELQEETGLQTTPDSLETFLGKFEGTWHWGDGKNHHTYVDHIYLLRINNFQMDDSNWTVDERRDILQYRWWNLTDLIDSGERVSPPGLLEALRNHLSF